MQDPVLKSYLGEFASTYNFQGLGEAELFEFFASYCVFFRDFSDYTDLEDAVIAGSNDSAIDAAGIFLNDIFVESVSQVDEAVTKARVEVDCAFVQAKTSRNLSAAEIGSFLQGVREFFSQRFMPVNEDVDRKRKLMDRVFHHSVRLKAKPKLHLFYCYTGSYHKDATIMARVEAGKMDLHKINSFSQVEFTFLDANDLQKRYQEVNLRVEKEITINEYASLPDIPGIRQSYLGVLYCTELIKLLSNSEGRLQKNLFNENVRDFLGRNPVNDDITKTIVSRATQGRLAALNNGLTIVARDIKIIGKKFTLSDFQIVNGCQTSHVVFENQQHILPETSITVKIIEAEDRELVNEIVRASNRQTEVKDEAFEVLGDFQKNLESFFASFDARSDRKLVYERRKRQYADSTYTARNIITLTSLTTSFVSVILENPVDALDYYGVILKKHHGKIFSKDQSRWPYLAAATILKGIESLCVGKARTNIWKFRFILALLIRRSFGQVPSLTDDKRQREFAGTVLASLDNHAEFIGRLTEAEACLARAIDEQGPAFDSRNAHQDRKFVDALLQTRVAV